MLAHDLVMDTTQMCTAGVAETVPDFSEPLRLDQIAIGAGIERIVLRGQDNQLLDRDFLFLGYALQVIEGHAHGHPSAP